LNVEIKLLIYTKRCSHVGKTLNMVHQQGKTGVAMSSSKYLTVQYATGQIGKLIYSDFSPVTGNCCNCVGYDAVHGFSDKRKVSSPRELLS
jgi:hypothetical protein